MPRDPTCQAVSTSPSLASVVSAFGAAAKAKLANPVVSGEPEDQLRAPLEHLLTDLAELCGIARDAITLVGESSLADLKTRPDYAVAVRGALVGFIELKAPGKGADPRRYQGHDKAQWGKLQSLPNLLYTDGNAFSLWRSGEAAGLVVRLDGDVESSGAALSAPAALLSIVQDFLQWQPVPPRTAKQLAEMSARLCRLLRDEVTEQMEQGSAPLTALATDWRKLLFPEATDAQFADGYAQTVVFGMLMARARGIELSGGLDQVSKKLGTTSSLIGTALRVLTDDAAGQATLKTSLDTLTRVLDAVHWPAISGGNADAWLYFYEDFLEVYDNRLRKLTGSYYTPPEVVSAMVRLVDEALRSPQRFGLHAGFAAPEVTVADPALGTGTFLLGVLRSIAKSVEADQGPGAVAAAVRAAAARLIGFEIQLGPFAVAQLRLLAELTELAGGNAPPLLRTFVTDTLGNPYVEEEWLPSFMGPIAESRRQANQIKQQERITVVIGNPPYKEKAKGRGGWVESGNEAAGQAGPLADWMPPADWGVGAHSKHLRNLYVYFWRWATWKVFDQEPATSNGVVCFITVAGFLNGPGFEKMRDYLRRTADEVWVVDCSPEGHQPEVNTRIFQGVQQPVCIVLASRSARTGHDQPAHVRFRSLPAGHREKKFVALGEITLEDDGWVDCPTEWRAPFLPASGGSWAMFPALEDLFVYNGSGVMPGRTWVIAPDAESLRRRWNALAAAPADRKDNLFHPHLVAGKPGDRHVLRAVSNPLPGFPERPLPVAQDPDGYVPAIRYAFRSFDRQWISPDNRLINRPNPTLWEIRSDRQLFLTAPSDRSPSVGPALSFTALVPDMHHYNGRGGRTFPLWRDRNATMPNVPPGLVEYLSQRFTIAVDAEDVMAYIAAVAAHPGFTSRFQADLTTPGLRIPIIADPELFAEAVRLGRTVVWLHTFGERFADPGDGRPAAPPRLQAAQGPRIPVDGAIPESSLPEAMEYDPGTRRLHIGGGYVENVPREVWEYEVSGKHVLRQWFSYRRANRERPIIGDRRPPSPLGDIQPDAWLAEYTTELLNVLHVLAWLVQLEPGQADLLDRICANEMISVDELTAAGAIGGRLTGVGAATEGTGEQISLL
jgi:hypothetical protein